MGGGRLGVFVSGGGLQDELFNKKRREPNTNAMG